MLPAAVGPFIRPGVVVFDFDGTIVTGHGPVLAYADALLTQLPMSERHAFRADLGKFLDSLDTGDPPLDPDGPADGYGMIRQLSSRLTAPPDWPTVNTAYQLSRSALAADGLGVRCATGLHDFLDLISPAAVPVLLTNAPDIGIRSTLLRTGLHGRFDLVITSADKPRLMNKRIDDILAGRSPHFLLSIGDNWRNDLLVPHQRGCRTALIANSRIPPASFIDFRAPTFNELAPQIMPWLNNLGHSVSCHAEVCQQDICPRS